MIFQIFFQEFYRWSDPHASRVGTEEIITDPHRGLLKEGFLLCVHRIDLDGLLAVSGFFQEFLVEFIRLYDSGLYDFGICFFEQRLNKENFTINYY